MADDLLDYTADTKVIGKPVGTDLKEGKLTMPIIYALNRATGEDRRRLEIIIQDPDIKEEDFEAVLELIKKYDGSNNWQTMCWPAKCRTPLRNAPKSPWRRCGSAQNAHILPCMLRFFACPAIALATADRPPFAENLYPINRSEVPPSGGALKPNSHF